MSIRIDSFLTRLDNILAGDSDVLPQHARYESIRHAVGQYSIDFPDTETDDVTGDGGKYYAIATSLTEWEEEFSQIQSIEYPAATVASDETPVYLAQGAWREDYWASDVRYLYLPNYSPAATETMRIKYTVPYEWAISTATTAVAQTGHGLAVDDYAYHNGTIWVKASNELLGTHKVSAVADANNCTLKVLQTTIPPAHFGAVCFLAACIACRMMAAKYAKDIDATISVGGATTTSNSEAFAARANTFCAGYREMMGLPAEGATVTEQGAGAFADWDTAPGWPTGRGYIFHGDR